MPAAQMAQLVPPPRDLVFPQPHDLSRPFGKPTRQAKSKEPFFCHRTNETLNNKYKFDLNRQVNVRQDKIIW